MLGDQDNQKLLTKINFNLYIWPRYEDWWTKPISLESWSTRNNLKKFKNLVFLNNVEEIEVFRKFGYLRLLKKFTKYEYLKYHISMKKN